MSEAEESEPDVAAAASKLWSVRISIAALRSEEAFVGTLSEYMCGSERRTSYVSWQ